MCPKRTEHNNFKYMKFISFFYQNLPVLRSILSAQYKINHRYTGATYDETKAVAIMNQEFMACQHANRQFCRIKVPFQPLANQPLCITASYIKNKQAIGVQCSLSIFHAAHTFVCVVVTSLFWIIASKSKTLGSTIKINCPDKATSTVPLKQSFHILRLSPACSTPSRYFHLPTHYKDYRMIINGSLDTANVHAIYISTQTSGYGNI